MLKWKNLRRKYIMMRYPQSSKNSITGKRKIRYCQEFVDRLSFLDTYLNATIVGKDLLENTLAQEKAIIKEETTIEKDELKGDEIEYIGKY